VRARTEVSATSDENEHNQARAIAAELEERLGLGGNSDAR
jgi:hypothetical protein